MKIVLMTGESKFAAEAIAKDCGLITDKNSH